MAREEGYISLRPRVKPWSNPVLTGALHEGWFLVSSLVRDSWTYIPLVCILERGRVNDPLTDSLGALMENLPDKK